MNKLIYSSDALNVLNKFYRVSAVVYVEGQDDIIFWNSIAKVANIKSIKIEDAGGSGGLVGKIDAIANQGARIIVAKDIDYSIYRDTIINHPRIITTYGHSIENTLYCPKSISNFISNLSRTLSDYSQDIIDWYNIFTENLKYLLIYDVASFLFHKGIVVFGNSCNRFLKNKNSHEVSTEKIDEFIMSIKDNFSDSEINKVMSIIDNDDRELRYIVKGHFMTSGVINLVKQIVKSKRNVTLTITTDHIFTSTVGFCANCSHKNCIPVAKMTNDLKNAISTCI